MKLALIGYGKMGRAIEEIALQHQHETVLKISSRNLSDLTSENIRKADVAIEFTTPESAVANIRFCVENHVPVVCGTTGWLDQMEEIKDLVAQQNGSFLYASNFSIGVNIFFELNKTLASLMKGRQEYDVEITETHHIHKKDAPSGTAITMAEAIVAAGKKIGYTMDQNKSQDELLIRSIREDEVPGTHEIKYFSDEDQLEIIHTAFNRKGFASGAVAAAAFIKDRKGIFTMKDVLGV